ncbi:cytochrome c oxidase subunit II [Sphingomicrobium lutaoense]|uniref:Cytochrome c oxidase subunit 2 n=1 Tax=Sphingomicrobium lutaoense TaxID=515949 RepID=A0A839Z527_9SPHN|nr:cytochrome c oxidase subunit II [Sphingomicrobium lutaoense]MBB3764983.1 cytochrome c oxidase subunit 2 [Sphingomicrobium lutaoense]
MILKRWLIVLAAALLAPATATATVQTPIGESAALAADLDDGEGETVDGEAAELFDYAAPVPSVGQPDGRFGLQDQFTEVGQYAADFHNNWLVPLITAISIFVLALLLYAMVRFRRSAHPEPSRTTHNTLIEVIWTVVPVIILVVIAVPSIKLIQKQYSPPPADVTIKVTGHQWYWTYQYPDNGGFEIISNMLKEKDDPTLPEGARYRTDADGPALLAVDERIVIPAGKTVKFIVTAADVIHSFAIPAFWMKMDAVPGRLNETWVKVDKPGVYFGQCSELCGARHAYMPIAIEVVPQAQYERWIASKGGTMPGAAPAQAEGASEEDAAPATPATPAEAEPNQPVTA